MTVISHAGNNDFSQSGPQPSVGEVSESIDQLIRRLISSNSQVINQDRQDFESDIRNRKIMIVDDDEVNVIAVRQHLKKVGYENFLNCTDARTAYPLVVEQKPDIVLLDIQMPYVNGLEILHAINQNPDLSNTPVVMLTAETDRKVKLAAIELGANDFLTKPLDITDLVSRVRNALTVRSHFEAFGQQKEKLEMVVKRRTKELYESRRQLILSLARAAEHRDNETGNHVIRVGFYAALIARQLGWKEDAVEMIQQAAQLHDVGRSGSRTTFCSNLVSSMKTNTI